MFFFQQKKTRKLLVSGLFFVVSEFLKSKFRQPFALRAKELDQIGVMSDTTQPFDKKGCPKGGSARALASAYLVFLLVFLSGCGQDQSTLLKHTSDKQEQNQLKVDFGGNLPVAIILDNLKESHPLSGIMSAKVVYEVPAEADITRFLGIFYLDSLPDKVGPVRSARPYLADLAGEYGSLFIHAGGSPEALEKIDQDFYDIYNLDEISRDGVYFWRDWQRQMPHNLYISGQSIINVIEHKNLENKIPLDFEPWKIKSDTGISNLGAELLSERSAVGTRELAEIVKIGYRENVIWQFDKEKNIYLRYQNGQPFVVESSEQVQTKNLIIQKTEIVILDEIGRRFIKTSGSGQALIFQQGFVIKGQWQKGHYNRPTRFYDDQGKEIEFLPGPIWIEIISDEHKLLY